MFYCFIDVVTIFVIMGISCITTINLPEVLSIMLMLILMTTLMLGGTFFIDWLVYHKNIKAFSFMDWLFRMKEVNAGWYNNKILLRVQHSSGIDDYSLQGFVRSIKNELVITDKSDRSKPIHIYIDITCNERTEIIIENVEE